MRPTPLRSSPKVRAALAAAAAVSLLAPRLLALLPFAPATRLVAGDAIGYLVPIGAAALLSAAIAARWNELSSSERTFFAGVSVALCALLASEIEWTRYAVTVDPAGPPAASWIPVAHFAAAYLALVVLIRMTRLAVMPLLDRTVFHVDLASLFAVCWFAVHLLVGHVMDRAGAKADAFEVAVIAAYPVLGSSYAVFSVLAVRDWLRGERAAWEGIVAGAFTLFGLALALASPIASLRSHADPGGALLIYTTAYAVGLWVLVLGLVERLASFARTTPFELWPVPRLLSPRRLRAFPVLGVTALIALILLAYATRGLPVHMPALVAAWSLSGLLALRSMLLVVERVRAHRAAQRDPVTGLVDDDALLPFLDEVLERAQELGEPVSVLAVEVCPGPGTAADLLLAREERLAALVRQVIASAPPGCEAFALDEGRIVLVWEGSDKGCALEAGLRLWTACASGRPHAFAPACELSIGVASAPDDGADGRELLARAEVALRAARISETGPVVGFEERYLSLTGDEIERGHRVRQQRAAVRALALAVDARDPDTRNHSANVAELAVAVARALGLSDHEVQLIGLGAQLHDIGKIGVPDRVLLKPGVLEPDEVSEIERHPELGVSILGPAQLDEIVPLVRSHHERWDGTGYPDGLVGERIPLAARIVAVCDAFETMTTGRTYQPAVSIADALAELKACAGTQFDPHVVEVFCEMIARMERTP